MGSPSRTDLAPPPTHPCLLPLHAPVCQLCTQLRLAYINSCFCEFLHPECSFRVHLSLLFYCYEEIISRPFLDENLFGKSVPELNEYRECNRLFFSSPPGTFLLPPHATAPAASICQTNKSTGPVHLSIEESSMFFSSNQSTIICQSRMQLNADWIEVRRFSAEARQTWRSPCQHGQTCLS